GAELVPEVNFCRQCGAAAPNASELPTATFDRSLDDTSTRRLDPRVTSPEPGFPALSGAAVSVSPPRAKTRWAPLLAIAAVLIVSMCVLAWFTLLRPLRH